MDYQFFHALNADEAATYLYHFIEIERRATDAMIEDAHEAGLELEYRLPSLPAVLKWLMGRVEFIRIPVPESEPDWIRKAHKDGIIEFDQDSKKLILRAAYYLGECFVRSYSALRWTIGNAEYMQMNLPVIAGFRSGNELPPMVVIENLFKRILEGLGPDTDIDRAIATWTKNAGGSKS